MGPAQRDRRAVPVPEPSAPALEPRCDARTPARVDAWSPRAYIGATMSLAVQSLVRAGTDVLTLTELAKRAEVDVAALQGAQRDDLTAWDVGMVTRLSRVVGVDPAVVFAGGSPPVPKLLAFLREAWGKPFGRSTRSRCAPHSHARQGYARSASSHPLPTSNAPRRARTPTGRGTPQPAESAETSATRPNRFQTCAASSRRSWACWSWRWSWRPPN